MQTCKFCHIQYITQHICPPLYATVVKSKTLEHPQMDEDYPSNHYAHSFEEAAELAGDEWDTYYATWEIPKSKIVHNNHQIIEVTSPEGVTKKFKVSGEWIANYYVEEIL